MTTPDAEAVAALADHGLTGCANPAHHDMCLVAAERKLTALNAAGWHLVRRSERRSAVIGSERSDNEALVAALDRERVLRDLLSPAERPGAGYPCRRCGRRDMGHEPSCWYTRVDAAIEGRP